MAELSQIEKGDVVYDIKDAYARRQLETKADKKRWYKIADFTLPEDLTEPTWFYINNDVDGTELDLSESLLIINAKCSSNQLVVLYQAYKENNNNTNYVIANKDISPNGTSVIHCELIGGEGAQYIRTTTSKHVGYGSSVFFHGAMPNPKPITGMSIQLPTGVLAGTTYEFWGISK